MELYPAIDLFEGRAVRLVRGDFGDSTVYDDDPVAVAAGFAADGARWLHVVDLDAARSGEPVNRSIVVSIAQAVAVHGVQIQAGGGIRSEEAAAAMAEAGVARVVIGTAALEDPDLVRRVAERQPVAVGIDGRAGQAAVRGWLAESATGVLDLLSRFEGAGVEAAIITEITRDGTLEGPDVELLRTALERSGLPLIASGGVGTIEHLMALAALEVDGRRLAGVITGKALYDGRFTVAEALAGLGSN
jgi:phosphoribosylformimino-5-aminoimidazole carboxamide ribotide isomerase